MRMAEFHFLRPLWLLALPFALWAAWRLSTGGVGADGWRAVVDRVLQPYVLSTTAVSGRYRWLLVSALAVAVLAALALAGPAWDRLPVPAYRSDESLVVALDLSRSMDAGDVEPSRLARARLKLLDLLERRSSGQTALIVFSSNAFTVTPLTNDTRTIGALVNALSTDIMPSSGSLVEVGLEKAGQLLHQSGTGQGDILLLTDAVASPAALDEAADLNREGIHTHVLAIGTEQGAPIPSRDGGFVTDDRGQVVVPQLQPDNLRRLAAAGGGRFARLATDDSDLDRLFPDESLGGVFAAADDDERQADIWRDQGVWLTLALLPLLALAFRRGVVYVVLAATLLPMPRAEAFTWNDLWQRPDQQAADALADDRPGDAAALFDNPEWAGVAAYRAGEFEASAAALAGVDTAEGQYNRGNALARSGKLEEAIGAYDRALEIEPDHADAAYNREVVAKLLEQQQQQQQEQEQEQQQQQQQQSDSGENGEQGQGGEPQDSDQQGQPQSSDSDDSSQNSEQVAQDSEDNQEPPQDPSEQSGDSDDDETGSEQQMAAATPEDVEDWASEQAADQWLRRIPQDPGGLLRRKFLYQYQQLGVDQDGNRIYPGSEAQPW